LGRDPRTRLGWTCWLSVFGRGVVDVPLSDDEQRMLRQIERQLEHERGLARSLRLPADSKQAVRNAKRATVGFFAGVVALLASFAFSWVIGLVAFLAMLSAAVVFVQSARRLVEDRWVGRAGADDEAEGQFGRRSSEGGWWPGRRASDQQDGEPS
jgi:hypothetical protein